MIDTTVKTGGMISVRGALRAETSGAVRYEALIVVVCVLLLLAMYLSHAYSGWKQQRKAFVETTGRTEMTTSSASFLARGIFGLANKE